MKIVGTKVKTNVQKERINKDKKTEREKAVSRHANCLVTQIFAPREKCSVTLCFDRCDFVVRDKTRGSRVAVLNKFRTIFPLSSQVRHDLYCGYLSLISQKPMEVGNMV